MSHYMRAYRPIYILNNPEERSDFVESASLMLPPDYQIQENNKSYAKVVEPLNSLTRLARQILLVSILASIVILSLVILLFLRDRKQELGIYLSLGEKKRTVLWQIMTEVLLSLRTG